ncbi:MAG: RNA 2',3'-cyclic phosphodiesterase [Firmicutes bacterium]|jgi:2'-5' RNA ligase|nr:RNA 2',3'-cyclic phosphodiesterase [Bacillota bacterium]
MRLFFALPLPLEVQMQLVAWQRLWSQTVNNVKWVKKDNLHLTLKFLGAVSPSQLSVVTETAHEALSKHSRFTIYVDKTGVFPHSQRARVLWVGLKDCNGCLARLQQDLEKCLASVGFPLDSKPFIPHLTLGRLRQPTAVIPPVFPVINEAVPINNVILYESILTPGGPLYRTQAIFDLL